MKRLVSFAFDQRGSVLANVGEPPANPVMRVRLLAGQPAYLLACR